METMVILTSLRELLVLHRWLLVKFAKDPKKATIILRLMLLRSVRDGKRRKYVRVRMKENT